MKLNNRRDLKNILLFIESNIFQSKAAFVPVSLQMD